jgi:hypothetical protein
VSDLPSGTAMQFSRREPDLERLKEMGAAMDRHEVVAYTLAELDRSLAAG